jgi:dipeptidyl aminopeptidase/acylaminoacyl peptidase
VARLRERGVPVRYDVYPDEGHSVAKRADQVRADCDAAEFLISHPVPDQPPSS